MIYWSTACEILSHPDNENEQSVNCFLHYLCNKTLTKESWILSSTYGSQKEKRLCALSKTRMQSKWSKEETFSLDTHQLHLNNHPLTYNIMTLLAEATSCSHPTLSFHMQINQWDNLPCTMCWDSEFPTWHRAVFLLRKERSIALLTSLDLEFKISSYMKIQTRQSLKMPLKSHRMKSSIKAGQKGCNIEIVLFQLDRIVDPWISSRPLSH